MHADLLQAARARASLCLGREAHGFTIGSLGVVMLRFPDTVKRPKEQKICSDRMPEIRPGTRMASVQVGESWVQHLVLKFGMQRLLDAALTAGGSPKHGGEKIAWTRRNSICQKTALGLEKPASR